MLTVPKNRQDLFQMLYGVRAYYVNRSTALLPDSELHFEYRLLIVEHDYTIIQAMLLDGESDKLTFYSYSAMEWLQYAVFNLYWFVDNERTGKRHTESILRLTEKIAIEIQNEHSRLNGINADMRSILTELERLVGAVQAAC